MSPELQQQIQNLMGDLPISMDKAAGGFGESQNDMERMLQRQASERQPISMDKAAGGFGESQNDMEEMLRGQVSDKEMDLYKNSLGMAEGGEVSREEMMMQAMEDEAEGQADPNEAIRSSIEELMMQASQAEDPAERDQYLHLAEAAEVGSQAPMGEMAIQLAQAGRGEDTALAHVRPGEVIIPPEAFEDPEFESLIEKKFEELNIDPSRMVVGVGIASLNPITGLEEFGFFKKLAKSVKKVVKKVVKPLAKVAQFIPGPWQPIAALANKAFTVYDVAKGRASPLSLLTMGKGVPAGGGSGGISSLFGGVKEFVTKGADGVGLLGNVGKGIGSLFTGGGADGAGSFGKLGDIFTGPGKDKIGSFGRIGDFFGGIGDSIGVTDYASQAQAQRDPYEVLDEIYQSEGDGSQGPTSVQQLILDMQKAEASPEEILRALEQSGNQQQAQGGGTPQWLKTIGDYLGFGGKSGLEDVYGPGAKNPLSGLFGGDGSGGGLNIGGLGGAGIAAVLAKLAYDEAKNRRGVQLTPAMTMNKYGGYQMAKRDAAAAGEAAPDPIDYGLLPSPMPLLSGGRPTPEDSSYGFGESQNEMEVNNPQADPVTGMRYGGAVMPLQMRYGGMVPMAYAEGGNVATEDFKRKNGGINGEGTETSDDIPAMLSDGEFVMTGQAVRGAGSFDLQSDGGIITLTPNGGESREKGTQLMYEMMELFAEFADKPKTKRAKAA
jgi:hypothetical protein